MLRVIYELSRLLIAGIFIYAGIGKIIDPENFARAINSYKLFPVFLIGPTAIILPWIEVLAGFAIYWRAQAAASIISVLLSIFSISIIINLYRGVSFDCGCFGDLFMRQSGPLLLFEDIILLIAAIFIFLYQSKKNFKSKHKKN